MDSEFLEILGCPADNEPLEFVAGKLVCTNCGRKYCIENEIPILLLDDKLGDETPLSNS